MLNAQTLRKLSGHYIAFEGADTAGKTTLARWFAETLEAHKVPHAFVREPGGTVTAEAIRKIILEPLLPLTPMGEVLLYFAARVELYYREILPALAEGKVVVSDRCLFSTVAYQAAGLKMGADAGGTASQTIMRLASLVLPRIGDFAGEPFVVPHLTFVLDIDEQTQVLRRKLGNDRIEARDAEYHERVRAEYRAIAKRFPRFTRLINAKQSHEYVRRMVERHINEYLPPC